MAIESGYVYPCGRRSRDKGGVVPDGWTPEGWHTAQRDELKLHFATLFGRMSRIRAPPVDGLKAHGSCKALDENLMGVYGVTEREVLDYLENPRKSSKTLFDFAMSCGSRPKLKQFPELYWRLFEISRDDWLKLFAMYCCAEAKAVRRPQESIQKNTSN